MSGAYPVCGRNSRRRIVAGFLDHYCQTRKKCFFSLTKLNFRVEPFLFLVKTRKSFQNRQRLWVFHNPNTYGNNEQKKSVFTAMHSINRMANKSRKAE
jgi:hypothetical protein